ncbi:MAG: ribosomal-processing cysteine protease Prp [Lachnospiraceae bacterium]|nr:ribosomal-processing cysteine protease Prp [Lachnospiraceae bacterium]
MIEIIPSERIIIITGHANYGPSGKDIVCAAVSALTQTLIESIEQLTDDTISYTEKSGYTLITFKELSAEANLLISSFFIGISGIEAAYPDNVRIIGLYHRKMF